jgi:hypothetical protein
LSQIIMAIAAIAQCIVAGGIIVLMILLYKYVQIKLNPERNKSAKIILLSNDKTRFISDDSKSLLVNAAGMQAIFTKGNEIFVEMHSGDTYLIRKCESDQEAKSYLALLYGDLNG